jgi:hypothetical protein
MMPAFLTTASVMMCPHGGTVSAVSSNTGAQAGGAYILRPTDTFTIAGCPFTVPPGVPNPCLQVQWMVSDLESMAMGGPTLNESSVGMCLGSAAPGPVVISSTQPQASGT